MSKPIIMVVDDQPDLVDGVKLILEVEGYDVWTAANGQHALDKLESTFMRRNEQDGSRALPDLILADIMMPVMDGYTLFERVKANPYLQNIPFIFLTAKVDDVDIRRGKELGVDDYLTKPAQPDDLLSSIRGKLKRTTSSGRPGSGIIPPTPTPPVTTSQTSQGGGAGGSIILIVAIVAILIVLAVVIYTMSM
ncbi:response regulator [Anaerolineales bacterium HSG6]|nr:response regulator [Anaerolineales bacterium HSG6]MDM8531132.1 response regulator [Anaerolineales bacterium HSG25]